MFSQKLISIILFVIATVAIIASLIVKFPDWAVYLIAILGIPLWILSLGFLTMAKPRPEDAEERVKEPFTGY